MTAFEVFEHLVDPREAIQDFLSISDEIIFSTQLVSESAPKVSEWWYYGPEHGQHISIWTKKSLEILANEHGLHYQGYAGVHVFSKRKISFLRYVTAYKGAALYNILKKRSGCINDYTSVKG